MTPLRNLFKGLSMALSSRHVRILLALTANMVAIASVFYMWAEGWGALDAVYFSVITIATVGYGDLAPQSALGKLFTIFYVLVGLGVFVAAASAIAGYIVATSSQRDRDEEQ